MTPASRSPQISEIDLVRSLTKDSFEDFIKEFWHTVVPDELTWNWHMSYLCRVLQREVERVIRGEPKRYDIVINVPPGSSKSTICSIMLPAWVWTKFPQATFICASYAASLAMDLSLKNRDVVKSDLYTQCFQDIGMRKDQDTKQHFINNHGGMRFAIGTGGSVTGRHAHFIIVDDPIDPLKSISEVEATKVNTWMSATLSTRKKNKDTTLTIIIMQRLHEDDPTGHILRQVEAGKRDILHICLPAEVSDKIKPKGLKRYYVDGLLDPNRLSQRALIQLQGELGTHGYAGQFQQDPVPFGGGMIHTESIKIEMMPPVRNIRSKVRYWDKAGSRPGKGGDYTVGVLMALDRDGRFWILDVVRGQWEAGEREKTIRQTAQIDGISTMIGIEQEPGSSGKESADNSVRNLAGFRVFIDRPSGDKASRADTFATQANIGNVRMCPGSWNREYLNELRFFPYSKHDDQVDATSGAFIKLSLGMQFIGGLPT